MIEFWSVDPRSCVMSVTNLVKVLRATRDVTLGLSPEDLIRLGIPG